MEQSTEPLVIGVRFSKVGKIYHFVADTVTDIKVGDMVVVETSRGWQLGQVAQTVPDADPPPEGWKPIDRRATPRDLLLRQMWQMKEAEVIDSCRARATDLNLSGIKIVSAEYSFDGSRLTVLFSSETEEKYDLKSLRSDMQKVYAPSQVEMRQIGPRDVAKVMCGMGACGLETRCCCLFLTEFSSISIRMAKEQGISLTPTEITGMCGRLRCCLIYEYDTYVEARQKLPKRNKRVRTPQGEGKVVDVYPLRGAVTVDLPEVGYREFPASEVQLVDGEGGQPAPAPFKGTQQPSEIDQAVVGEERPEPFEISSEKPPLPSPWENPPAVEEPRSMPRPEQRPASPHRQGGQRRGGRDMQGGRGMPGGKEAPGGKETPASKETPAGREAPGSKNQPAGQAEQRPPRQGGRTGRGSPGNRPQHGQGGRGQRKEGPASSQSSSQASPSDQPGEQTPHEQSRSRSESGGNPPRGGRDQRRRKGPRRDSSNNDNENRA